MADIVLLGCGGHGRVVLDALLEGGSKPVGIVDPLLRAGELVFGIPVLGNDEVLLERGCGSTRIVNGVGCVPRSTKRIDVYNRWSSNGFDFVSVCHPRATVSANARIGRGVQVMAGAVAQCGTEIGENAVVNTRASIDHDCRLGSHVFIGPGAVLCGNVTVGSGAFVGAGAILLPGVAVGAAAVVGAGSIVTRDVPPHTLVIGNPASVRKWEVAHD